jgi:HEAT repeats
VKHTLALLAVAQFAAAQAPVIGDINFYGLRKTQPDRILSTLHIQPGGALPASKGDMEERIADMPEVVLARVEAVCCEGKSSTLFIGVEERGAPHAAFRSDPQGNASLPASITDAYRGFLAAVQRAASRGNAAEDLTTGQSRMADPAARKFQEQFSGFAAAHLADLQNVMREAADPDQRAMAVAILGYAPKKAEVIADLQFALQDPDEAVRANSVRALNAIAVFAAREPNLKIVIEPTWFVEMLNSIVLSDRMEAVKALLTLTDHDGHGVIEQVRERALPALAEMSRWKSPAYALPPFMLIGRAAGMTDIQIQRSWEKADRESVIRKALGPTGGKRREE